MEIGLLWSLWIIAMGLLRRLVMMMGNTATGLESLKVSHTTGL